MDVQYLLHSPVSFTSLCLFRTTFCFIFYEAKFLSCIFLKKKEVESYFSYFKSFGE